MHTISRWSASMPRIAIVLLTVCLILPAVSVAAQASRDVESDKRQLLALEDQWLHARDTALLDRILAADFVHPVPAGVFLTKRQHIDWFAKHLPPASSKTRLEQVKVRIYGDTAIVNGMVIASDETGKELHRTVFTDVFVYRDGRWQAVNAQENRVANGG
jgi:hypothetical protein